MDKVPISQLKASFDKILKRAQKTKQPIRIAYRGKRVADILLRKPTPDHQRTK
jgi:prevent-host-death family protein